MVEDEQQFFLEIKINEVRKYFKYFTSGLHQKYDTEPGRAEHRQQPALPARLARGKPHLFTCTYTHSQPLGMTFLSAVTPANAPHILLNLYLRVSPFDAGAAASQSSCFWCSVLLSEEDSLTSEGLQDPRRQQGREIHIPCYCKVCWHYPILRVYVDLTLLWQEEIREVKKRGSLGKVLSIAPVPEVLHPPSLMMRGI